MNETFTDLSLLPEWLIELEIDTKAVDYNTVSMQYLTILEG